MPEKKLTPMQMPDAWREMVCLALRQSVAEQPSSWDWKALRTFTVKNNMATLVYNGAERELAREYRNHPNMIELRLLTKMNRLQSRSRIQALSQIAGQFQKADIPMLSFKGPLLSMELYEDPELRNSCDLDILVAEKNLTDACCCLQEMGYVRQVSAWDATPKRQAFRQRQGKQMHLLFRKNGIMVELHWRICYRFAVPFDTLWDSRRCFLLGEQPVYTLGNKENLCYLVTHGAGHGFRQLRWLLEIHTLLERENFCISPLYSLMKQRGVAVLLLEALLLLYRLPGFPMPDRLCIPEDNIQFQKTGENTILCWEWRVDSEVRRARVLANTAYPLLQRTNPEEGLNGRVYRHLLPTLGNRQIFLLSLFAPDAAELEWLDLPDKLFFMYYFLRPIFFIHGHRKKKGASAPKAVKNGDKIR